MFARPRAVSVAATVVLCVTFAAAKPAAADAWADHVVSFIPGAGADPTFGNPTVTLGSPERFTGEGVFPSVVSIFSPPFGTDELLSIGFGGSLIVEFDEPITDDPGHPSGIDLIVFGNGGFADADFPNGLIGDPPFTFGLDPMGVSVSADGVTFVLLGTFTEGLFPTQGYLDSGPFDGTPGNVPTNFTRPVDPTLTLDDFAGLTLVQALGLYDGSGGGTPIDIGPAGLGAVRFVRIEGVTEGVTVEIDAFAAVPEPVSANLVLGLIICQAAFRRRW